MKKNESKKEKELDFYKIFFHFTLPGMIFIILTGTIYPAKIPLKYVVFFGIELTIIIIVAYIWAKWILKSPKHTKWATQNWWRIWCQTIKKKK